MFRQNVEDLAQKIEEAKTDQYATSGARYTDSAEQNLFWITGKTARFEVLGEYARDCAVID